MLQAPVPSRCIKVNEKIFVTLLFVFHGTTYKRFWSNLFVYFLFVDDLRAKILRLRCIH